MNRRDARKSQRVADLKPEALKKERVGSIPTPGTNKHVRTSGCEHFKADDDAPYRHGSSLTSTQLRLTSAVAVRRWGNAHIINRPSATNRNGSRTMANMTNWNLQSASYPSLPGLCT